MNTKLLFTTVLGGAALAVAHAQQPATPTTPAPTVVSAPQAAPAPVAAPAQTVYTPRLPTANDLTNAAAAQGISVERIEQGANQVVATYRYANGQTSTVVYQALPPAGAPAATVQTQVVQAPPPAVVYEQAPRTVYVEEYYGPRYYPYPYAYYPPVSLSFGFGYRGGYYGGYHGGYRGGYHHR